MPNFQVFVESVISTGEKCINQKSISALLLRYYLIIELEMHSKASSPLDIYSQKKVSKVKVYTALRTFLIIISH